jgi:hypothetical protein
MTEEETTFKLCRREPIEKENSPVKFCAKPIDKPNANNWCAECRKRLPYWPTGKSVEDPALTKPGAAPAPLTPSQTLVSMGDFL